MLTLSPFAFIAICACVLLGSIWVIARLGRKLAVHDPSDVRIIWYLFSLSATLTLIVAWWASGAGAIDATGSFRGTAGNWLLKILKGALDIQGAMMLYGGLVGVVVVPQLASWLLSGLFGCASSPVFVGPVMRFFSWGIVKSFVVIAGVLVAATAYGWFRGWDGMNARQATTLAGTALMAITSAFCVLHMYRDFTKPWVPMEQPGLRAAKLRRLIYKVNAWMNRRIRTIDVER